MAGLLVLLLIPSGCTARDAAPDDRGDTPPPAPETERPEEETPREKPVDLSLEGITAGLSVPVTTELTVTRPEMDVSLVSGTYYITGTSDPERPLLLNGEPVEGRGPLGSFGVYVELEPGENTFAFLQGEASETVTITRSEYEDYTTVSGITKAKPDADIAIRAGEGYTLSCVAPAGASVTAEVNGQVIEMSQRAVTEVKGIAATFIGSYDPAGVSGTIELGPVTYTLTDREAVSAVTSAGSLYAVGAGDELLVRARDVSSAVFSVEDPDGEFYTTLRQGAVDRVEEIGYANPGEEMYRLSMGGWVFKDTVEPLTGNPSYRNEISNAEFFIEERRETLILTGTAPIPYEAEWGTDSLTISFHNTIWAGQPDVTGSALFSGASAAPGEDGEIVITLRFRESDALWGYLVEYDGNDTVLTFAAPPVLAEGDRPLTGITIALDPGHGGPDAGAFGVAWENGANEAEINLATSNAVARYLRGLGADVFFTRSADGGETSKVELNDRLAQMHREKPDLMISLHSNSMSYAADGTGASGVEVYYYEDASHRLAEALADSICERTGRKNRGAKQDYYKVTLNSYTPTAMVEMGFLTNPVEYDALRGAEGMYDMAAAIGEAVVELLGGGAADAQPGGQGG